MIMSELGKSFPTNVDKLKSEVGSGGSGASGITWTISEEPMEIYDPDYSETVEHYTLVDVTPAQFEEAVLSNAIITVVDTQDECTAHSLGHFSVLSSETLWFGSDDFDGHKRFTAAWVIGDYVVVDKSIK